MRRAVLHLTRGDSHRQTLKVCPTVIVPASVVVRSAVTEDAAAIHTLIVKHAAEGRLLPRSVDEIAAHIDRFVVATVADERRAADLVRSSAHVIGCADLAPLSSSLAEVRSLVVDSSVRATGVGRRLLGELIVRARKTGFDALCAFTHAPAYFVQSGFSLVPHAWLPEKIDRDCRGCSLFRRCGQSAVVLPLAASQGADADRRVGSGNVVRLQADPTNDNGSAGAVLLRADVTNAYGDASDIALKVASVNG